MGESKRKTQALKLALINVCLRPHMQKRTFPIGLGYIASAVKRAGFSFTLIDIDANRYTDDELETMLRSGNFDIIAFGALVTGYKIAKGLSALIKKVLPGSIVIAGNSVASSVPEVLLSKTGVDIAVIGEGDITIIELLKALEQGKPLESVEGIYFKKNGAIVATAKRQAISNIDTIPIPDWDLFDMEAYIRDAVFDVPEPYPIPKENIRAFVVNTARGCAFRCSFCYHVFQRDKYRHRSPGSILNEISLLQERYGINYVNFFDELTFFRKDQAAVFIDGVLASGLKFFWNIDVRSDLFNETDIPLLEKMREAGCLGMGYSLESADEEILKSMNKRLKVNDFARQKMALDKAGIRTFTSIVLGYPQETLKTLKKTFDLCYDLNVYPSVGYLLPQPGTPMYEIAREQGLAEDEEQYLMRLGDRQDLRFNLTKIPNEVFESEVKKHLMRIAGKIKLDLPEDKLIKTGTFVASKDHEKKS